jgi:proteasome accessory factor A
VAIPKVLGTETEYGIAAVGVPDFNPVLSSSLLISTFAGSLRRIRWDYEQESPLRDARGFEPIPSREVSDEDLGLANVILPNGARYYVDHAHPEYSTPECLTPRELVIHDKAGERILERSMREVATQIPEAPALLIYKNNSDGKGNSYGTHENYLVDRQTPFADIVRDLTPFFVSRQVFCGAGKLGSEAPWDERGRPIYQLTQRADFFETEVGLETTLKRPIINTRDEPHADAERYRRLHVIVGDSNMSEWTTFMKVGITDLVLRMVEENTVMRDLTLENPIRAIREISHDVSCRRKVRLANGRELSAIEIQAEYFERTSRFVEHRGADAASKRLLREWESAIDALSGGEPERLVRKVDWVTKQVLIDRYRARNDLPLSHPKVALMDLAYHDVNRQRGLYYLLERNGKVDRAADERDVQRAMREPPATTRAKLRGDFIRQAKQKRRDYTVDWVHLKLNDQAQRTVLCKDPFKAVDERVEQLIAHM